MGTPLAKDVPKCVINLSAGELLDGDHRGGIAMFGTCLDLV